MVDRLLRALLVSLPLAAGFLAPLSVEGSLPPEPSAIEALGIPDRPLGAISGTRFAEATEAVSDDERGRMALSELEQGNLPSWLRRLQPVHLSYSPPQAEPLTATVWVMPDYLSIGDDLDFLPIPLDYYDATAIANRFGFLLPTPRIVDAIYSQAARHLRPQPLPAGPLMRSSGYVLHHRDLIEAQLGEPWPEGLIAGHKKDVVLTNRLLARPERVAIYGWHLGSGEPIQPLSLWHGAGYADYSHGIRLVYPTVWIDGEPTDLAQAMEDPLTAPLFSDEGPIQSVARLMHPQGLVCR